mmetsp:Transcript_2962/g.6027  ORF Transcript_2962/g.6027 Transcript_2962/m.6027 type:complete len:223 (-) Transcript_2962:760-1428(-)
MSGNPTRALHQPQAALQTTVPIFHHGQAIFHEIQTFANGHQGILFGIGIERHEGGWVHNAVVVVVVVARGNGSGSPLRAKKTLCHSLSHQLCQAQRLTSLRRRAWIRFCHQAGSPRRLGARTTSRLLILGRRSFLATDTASTALLLIVVLRSRRRRCDLALGWFHRRDPSRFRFIPQAVNLQLLCFSYSGLCLEIPFLSHAAGSREQKFSLGTWTWQQKLAG